jgi:GntR family transcriptional regulator
LRISVTKRSGVPVVDQIATQFMLAIISGELRAEQRLPSMRALATRLRVHLNSVRAAYLSLEQRNWIQLRRGSGAYVRSTTERSATDRLVRSFIDSARAAGMTDERIRHAIDDALETQQVDSILVVEPEIELRKIVMAEIAEATQLPVDGAAAGASAGLPRTLVVALAARAAAANTSVIPDLWLQVNSPTELLSKQQRPPADSLVTFVSRSPDLLRVARDVLLASGWTAEALEFRDARQPGWRRGLRGSALIIADTLTARNIPVAIEVKRLRVISGASLLELKALLAQSHAM